jgi:hypothetical protein
MASNDPAFEEKAADIIGLYVNPPQHAAIFCVDDNSAKCGSECQSSEQIAHVFNGGGVLGCFSKLQNKLGQWVPSG